MKRNHIRLFFSPDENGGGSGGSGGGNADGTANTGGGTGGGSGASDNSDQSGTPDKETPASSGDSNNSGGDNGGRVKFDAAQQAHVDRLLAAERERTRKASERKAEETRLAEQGKHKELHELLQTRVTTELEPKAKLADDLSSDLNELLEDEIKNWPPALKKQDPGKDKIRERSQWVKNSRDLAKQLATGNQAPNGEHGNNSGGGAGKPADTLSIVNAKYHRPGAKK